MIWTSIKLLVWRWIVRPILAVKVAYNRNSYKTEAAAYDVAKRLNDVRILEVTEVCERERIGLLHLDNLGLAEFDHGFSAHLDHWHIHQNQVRVNEWLIRESRRFEVPSVGT